jgi:hypothetical protein
MLLEAVIFDVNFFLKNGRCVIKNKIPAQQNAGGMMGERRK